MARIYLSPPHLSGEERTLVEEAFTSNWVAPLGPHVDAFERELCARVGVAHGAALSSGTAALHLALRALGVGAGDEVLLPTLTFAATAFAVQYVGATPVFVDADPATWQIDPALVTPELERAAKRGRLPKALVTVDLYGQCADYAALSAAATLHGIPIIEDAAEALGATYGDKPAGSLGALGVFSFNGNKIITTGGGGMLVSNRAQWIDKARFWSTQARDKAPHYEHSEIGYNYRLSNLLAAVGRAQLRVLDARVAARRQNNVFYRAALAKTPGVTFMPEAPYGRSTAWLTCITIDPVEFGATREEVRLHLEKHDIESRPVWKPMHLQPVFHACRAVGGAVAADLFAHGLCLPSGSSLTDGDRSLIIETFLATPRRARSQ